MIRPLASIGLALLVVAAYAVPASLPSVHAQWSDPTVDIPAYHQQAPAPGEVLPPILSGKQLTGPYFQKKWQVEVYKQAAQIPNVLYQLPCYCHCDRALGHKSLHSCFEGNHGAICATCAAEEAYAYKMTRRGRTPKQIRTGIEHQDFNSIDLSKLGRS